MLRLTPRGQGQRFPCKPRPFPQLWLQIGKARLPDFLGITTQILLVLFMLALVNVFRPERTLLTEAQCRRPDHYWETRILTSVGVAVKHPSD